MSYLWIPAIHILVSLHDNDVVAFTWDGQNHRVVFITEAWRVDVEWWRVRVWRDYYRIVSDKGYLVVIYQDLLDSNWYLQQVYD